MSGGGGGGGFCTDGGTAFAINRSIGLPAGRFIAQGRDQRVQAVAPPAEKSGVGLLGLRVEAEPLEKIELGHGRQAEHEDQKTPHQKTGQKAQQARHNGVEKPGKLHLQPARQTGKAGAVGDEQRGHGDAHQRQGIAEAVDRRGRGDVGDDARG